MRFDWSYATRFRIRLLRDKQRPRVLGLVLFVAGRASSDQCGYASRACRALHLFCLLRRIGDRSNSTIDLLQ